MNGVNIPLFSEELINRSTVCHNIHLLSQLHAEGKVYSVSVTKDDNGKAVVSFVVDDVEV